VNYPVSTNFYLFDCYQNNVQHMAQARDLEASKVKFEQADASATRHKDREQRLQERVKVRIFFRSKNQCKCFC
jgi:hypothetical protein